MQPKCFNSFTCCNRQPFIYMHRSSGLSLQIVITYIFLVLIVMQYFASLVIIVILWSFISVYQSVTSCARGDAICLRPCKLTISSYLFARWHLFRHVGYLRHQQQVDLWPFDLESGVRVTYDVGYICANFSLPKPLCSRVRPDVRDRQTSDKTIA